MSPPTLQRPARLGIVPVICTSLAMAAGAYANKDKAANTASVAVQAAYTGNQLSRANPSPVRVSVALQAADTGDQLSRANPSPAKVIGGALGSRLPSPRADGYGNRIPAGAGQCNNDCGDGDVPEGEVCAGNNYVDETNGGCNSVPSVFGDAFCGVIICGTSSNFDTTGDGQSNSRDTDWYLITQAELESADTDGNGVVQIQSILTSEFDGVTFFIAFNPDCDTLAFPGTIGFSGEGCAGGESARAALIIEEHPAGIVVFVSTGASDGTPIFAGFECSTEQNDYTLLIECIELPIDCAPDSGPCGEPNGSPGCEDPDCCAAVCEADPFCCIEPWSQNCANIAIGLGCAFGPVECPAGGDTELTQSLSDEIVPFNSVACTPDMGMTTSENSVARSYDLGAILPGQALEVTCVAWGIEVNSQDVDTEATVNIYEDTNGGAPLGPGVDLVLLGSQPLLIAANDDGAILVASFDPPVQVPAGTIMVIELDIPDTSGITGIWPGSNPDGQTGPSYIRSASCDLPEYADLAAIGFPNMHLVNIVIGNAGGGNPCPADLVVDGAVGVKDLLFLLGAWGPCPKQGQCPADLVVDGAVGVKDLLFLLGAWGPCP